MYRGCHSMLCHLTVSLNMRTCNVFRISHYKCYQMNSASLGCKVVDELAHLTHERVLPVQDMGVLLTMSFNH